MKTTFATLTTKQLIDFVAKHHKETDYQMTLAIQMAIDELQTRLSHE